MKRTRRNILVTCGGKWVGHILQLREAAQRVDAMRGAEVFVADCQPITPAGQFADGSFQVPPIADPAYPQELIRICRNHDIGLLVPLIDIDVERLTASWELFAGEGVALVAPPTHIAKLCFDKRCFSRWAVSKGITVPQVIDHPSLDAAKYPLFAKPACGFGSIGARICRTADEARQAAEERMDLVFEEYLSGPEYSADGYVNRAGTCVICVVRIREKVVGGEAYRSHTVREPEVFHLARRTIETLAAEGHRGPINVQIIRGDNKLGVIDVNPRLGSASLLSNQATDGRLFEGILREAVGETVWGDPGDYRVGLQLWRFLGEVFYQGDQVHAVFPPVPRASKGIGVAESAVDRVSQPAGPHFHSHMKREGEKTLDVYDAERP